MFCSKRNFKFIPFMSVQQPNPFLGRLVIVNKIRFNLCEPYLIRVLFVWTWQSQGRVVYGQRQSLIRLVCCRNGNTQPSAQASHTSLVPYPTESSDSDSESTATKHKASFVLTPVKNGFAKENSSSAKFSNCSSSATSTFNVSCKSEPSEVLGKRVVNGWHVTEVARRSPSDTVYSPPQNWDVIDTAIAK